MTKEVGTSEQSIGEKLGKFGEEHNIDSPEWLALVDTREEYMLLQELWRLREKIVKESSESNSLLVKLAKIDNESDLRIVESRLALLRHEISQRNGKEKGYGSARMDLISLLAPLKSSDQLRLINVPYNKKCLF